MNVGNLALHQWIITTKPEIVHNYIQFDDENPFYSIIFKCTLVQDSNVPLPDKQDEKLTAIVTYKTLYVDENYNSVHLSFGLGRDVTVNFIIGKPAL